MKRKQVQSCSSSDSSSDESEAEVPKEAIDQTSVAPTSIKSDWKNRERVLVLCSRGCNYRDRHLMQDLRKLMPHSKKESKIDKNRSVTELNDIAQMNNCSKIIYFESRKKKDLYLWLSNVSGGPSAKFLVHNTHTMGELRLSGNCLKGSRPILSFDKEFETQPHLQVLKEIFIQTMGTPRRHPRSQPFFDHVYTFSPSDGKIWFRNYEIIEESGQLQEIGPRMVLELISIFSGSMCGAVLYQNPEYKNPNFIRRQLKQASGSKYANRVESKKGLQESREKLPVSYKSDALDSLFDTPNPDDEEDDVKCTLPAHVARINSNIMSKTKKRNKKKPKVE